MRAWIFLPLLAAAGGVHAEGARLDVACSGGVRCGGDASCATREAPLHIVVEPELTDAEGMGIYLLWVDDSAGIEARGLSRTGPFAWVGPDARRHVLTVTGTGSAVLLTHSVGPAPEARTDFLSCEVIF